MPTRHPDAGLVGLGHLPAGRVQMRLAHSPPPHRLDDVARPGLAPPGFGYLPPPVRVAGLGVGLLQGGRDGGESFVLSARSRAVPSVIGPTPISPRHLLTVWAVTPHQWQTDAADSRRTASAKPPNTTRARALPPGRLPMGQGMGASLCPVMMTSPRTSQTAADPYRNRGVG
jgi:hypothetical protein